ncbi:PaaI family thioesterase [Salipiger sp. 1_MG-2023]|uniref:PaaI family thioesterase n=1 Tax=Salipiger sp. 1_MG-2023 TaxID=3062665 RepID=UPI0026E23453|nr:PaaI family thioesterase [Salipiger sp. 1_MG-2023]MDO6587926.1 PaaI family thioesterase [Salipiger sp. 1_MG-2023]
MSTDHTETARRFMEAIPQAQALGLEILEMQGGVAVIRMPYAEALVGDPETGVIHGGAVSTLMDTCGGAATISHPGNAGGTATIGLRIDYLRGATPGQAITARAECHHVTRSVAFVRATAHDDDPDRPVATATGTFTVEAKP